MRHPFSLPIAEPGDYHELRIVWGECLVVGAYLQKEVDHCLCVFG